MTLDLPVELEEALEAKARLRGISLDMFVQEALQRTLIVPAPFLGKPLKTGYGTLARYGPAPSAEDIDENAREMWKGFGDNY